MPIRHVRTHSHDGAASEDAAADLDATFGHYALKRQAEWWVEAHRFIDAGIKVWQFAYLAPLWEGSRDSMILLRSEELGMKAVKSSRVREEVVPDAAQDNSGGIRASDDVRKCPCCYRPEWCIRSVNSG